MPGQDFSALGPPLGLQSPFTANSLAVEKLCEPCGERRLGKVIDRQADDTMPRLCCELEDISSMRAIIGLFPAMAVFWQTAQIPDADVRDEGALGGNSCDPWWPQVWSSELQSSAAADSVAWCISGPTSADCRRHPLAQLDR